MKMYDLRPTDGRKSFYGKAVVMIDDNGTETLYSYNTPIIERTPTGEMLKLWDGWTATTGRHISAFCGLNKAQYTALPMKQQDSTPAGSGGRTLTNAESYAAMIGRRTAGKAATA